MWFTTVVDNNQNFHVLSTCDDLRANFYQLEIGPHLYDKNKKIGLHQLGFQDRLNGRFFTHGLNMRIKPDVRDPLKDLHAEAYPTLKYGIPMTDLYSLYQKYPKVELALTKWQNLTLDKDFCKDYPNELADLVRVIGYSKGDYSRIEPFMERALEISKLLLKSNQIKVFYSITKNL